MVSLGFDFGCFASMFPCPSQILHRRPQDSLPLLFLDLWFWDFLQETLRKGRQCFDPWAAFENTGTGFERGTHEETQLLQYTTVPPWPDRMEQTLRLPIKVKNLGTYQTQQQLKLLLSIPLLCVRLDLAAVPAPTVGLLCHFFASRHEELARGALPTHCGETGRSAVFLMFFSLHVFFMFPFLLVTVTHARDIVAMHGDVIFSVQ